MSKNRRERKEYLRNYMQVWRKTHKRQQEEYYDKVVKPKTEKLKRQVFEKLGNKCANPNCPIPRDKLDVRGLEIDHVYNDGKEDRKTIRYYDQFLKKVLADTEGNYQLLCIYCNRIKAYEKQND